MSGTFRLGVIPTLGPYIVPTLIARIREQHPQLELVMNEAITEQIVEELDNHQLDVILVATKVDGVKFASQPLFTEPFWLAHHRDDQLYDVAEITDRQLREIPLLLLSEGHCLVDQISLLKNTSAHAGRSKQAEKIERLETDSSTNQFRAASLDTLLQLVAAGAGATVVPALALGGPWTTDTGIIAKPLKNRRAARTVSMVFRQGFPRLSTLSVVANLIQQDLPNTVSALEPVFDIKTAH